MTRMTRDRSLGQTLVEFALVVPLFMLVVLAIAEGGYYVVATSIVNHATHEGARLGVLASTATTDTVKEKVKAEADTIVGLTDGDVAVCVLDVGCRNSDYQKREAGDRLRVTTTYTHQPLVGYVFSNVLFGASATAELRVEGGPTP